jgi:hypothetical protein
LLAKKSNNKNKNLTVESSSAGDIKLLKTKAKVATERLHLLCNLALSCNIVNL